MASLRPLCRRPPTWAASPTSRASRALHASRASPACLCRPVLWRRDERRELHLDARNRLSNIWVPAPQLLKEAREDKESHVKLMRAGFFRQAHAGVFHMLPMGLRVQDKIEAVVDKHMKAIGGSRVSLSSITSARLWARSGRLDSVQGELFQFADRKGAKYLLSPTHEEEITELVSQNVQSYRGLPLRLYQITRKYRDEMRPRYGILRAREFIMKDMYSFDATAADAMATYAQVRAAYAAVFAELKVPVLAARASSGDMGGDLSHEYHLPATLGEDDVAHCAAGCGFAANTEVLAVPAPRASPDASQTLPMRAVTAVHAWRGITHDRRTLVNVWYAAAVEADADANSTDGAPPLTSSTVAAMTDADIDAHAVKAVVADLDTSLENTAAAWDAVLEAAGHDGAAAPRRRIVNLVDWRVAQDAAAVAQIDPRSWPSPSSVTAPVTAPVTALDATPDAVARLFDVGAVTTQRKDIDASAAADARFNFATPRTGDDCPGCGARGALVVDRAIELGHTFYLGTRYTGADALDVRVQAEQGGAATLTPHMGCYGLGISRILGAVADHAADRRGLNWPRAIAPYEVVVIAPDDAKHSKNNLPAVAEGVYDVLAGHTAHAPDPLDVLLDDRAASLPYKLKDADLTGYPVVVVVGKAWRKTAGDGSGRLLENGLPEDGLLEVQCRQLGVRQDVPLGRLRTFVAELLDQL